jgi:hypothetical protein
MGTERRLLAEKVAQIAVNEGSATLPEHIERLADAFMIGKSHGKVIPVSILGNRYGERKGFRYGFIHRTGCAR